MSDAEAVIERIRAEGIGAYVVTDYGWPGEIELALVDAVSSIRARYGTPTSGVLGRVLRYRSTNQQRPLDDLPTFARQDPRELHDIIGSQRSAGRLKSDICLDVAARLVEAGVFKASDLRADQTGHKRAWTGTVGLGWVTWEYFTMLLGYPGVKADTMINRFVAGALGLEEVPARRAHAAVTGAATAMHLQARDLDHAIWRHQSGRPIRR